MQVPKVNDLLARAGLRLGRVLVIYSRAWRPAGPRDQIERPGKILVGGQVYIEMLGSRPDGAAWEDVSRWPGIFRDLGGNEGVRCHGFLGRGCY